MGNSRFLARLADKRELSDRVWLFHLELVKPTRIEFRAGQWVKVGVGEKEREYFIASTPETDHRVDLVVDLEGSGMGAEYWKGLELGRGVELVGPRGDWGVRSSRDLVLVVEKMAVVGARSVVVDLLRNKQDKRKIRLHWGLVYVEELFWEEELHQLEEEYDNFRLDIVLARPPYPEWKLCSGTVLDCLEGHGEEVSEREFLVGGGKRMVEEVRKWLEKKGVEQKRIVVQEM